MSRDEIIARLKSILLDTDERSAAALDSCEPVLETMKGWKQDISGVRRWEDLPKEARDYVCMIEDAIGCPIRYVSVGPERDSIIER